MGWELPRKGGSGYTPANKDVLDALTDNAGKLEYKGIPIGTEITSISATNVIETSSRQFTTASEKSQISSATAELSSHSQRLFALESATALPTPPGSDGKVKINETDIAGYLDSKVDTTTIVELDNKLSAVSLSGLISTIHELNQLQGITANVQGQLNALTSVGNFTGSVPTFADIAVQYPAPTTGDMVIVVADETHTGDSTIYVYNGSNWAYSGKFTATVRDFSVQPLNLSTESAGVLAKNKYEKQNAAETVLADAANYFTATNVEDALAELFLFASSFKQSVVTAIGSPLVTSDTRQDVIDKVIALKVLLSTSITNKGVPAYPYNTLGEMAGKIAAIPNVQIAQSVKKTSKLNVTAPYTHTITLVEPLSVENIAATVLEYLGADTGVVHYQADYNNGDASSFTFNADGVIFDGFMRMRDEWNYPLVAGDGGQYVTQEINFNDFSDIKRVEIDSTNSFTVRGIKSTQEVIQANGDISLAGVESVDSISVVSTTGGSGQSKVALSFDSGATFKAWNGIDWDVVDINNKNDFQSKGMSVAVVQSLTDTEISLVRNGSTELRFAYYLERPTFDDVANNDKITVSVSMKGNNDVAKTQDYEYSYDPLTKELTYLFKKSGTYTITYVDGQ